MKRNATNDNDDQFISARKKLKFGVDTILGNVNNHSDNDLSSEISNNSNDELKHKVHVSIHSPVCSNEQVYAQPYGLPSNNPHPTHPLWRTNLRPYIGNYLENNGPLAGNGFYVPSPMSSLLWSLDMRSKTRPKMLRRAVFSDQQRRDLEAAFLKQKYITKPDRKKLAQRLGLKDSQVKIWFQNRRMKWRNTKERELFTNEKTNCCDYQSKEEFPPCNHINANI